MSFRRAFGPGGLPDGSAGASAMSRSGLASLSVNLSETAGADAFGQRLNRQTGRPAIDGSLNGFIGLRVNGIGWNPGQAVERRS
jgi:hypothetical protein